MKVVDWSVYVITDRGAAGDRSILEVVRAAIRGGATVVQFREKSATTREMIALGQALHEMTMPAGVPLIVNDRLDVALAIGAEGVHVGVDDMPVAVARRLMGPDRLVGYSPDTVEAALRGQQQGADYLGIGDVFGTPSKPDAGEPIGLGGLAAVVDAVSIPVVAIGGITVENAPAVARTGAAGVAVISAVIGAEDPEGAVRRLKGSVSGGRHIASAEEGAL
jgi:thiamine-phosphate pyrophosphorylase